MNNVGNIAAQTPTGGQFDLSVASASNNDILKIIIVDGKFPKYRKSYDPKRGSKKYVGDIAAHEPGEHQQKTEE